VLDEKDRGKERKPPVQRTCLIHIFTFLILLPSHLGIASYHLSLNSSFPSIVERGVIGSQDQGWKESRVKRKDMNRARKEHALVALGREVGRKEVPFD